MGDDLMAWLRAQLDMREKEIALIAKLANAPEEHTRMLLAEVDAKRRIIDVYQADVIDVSVVPGRPEWMHGAVPVEAHTVLRLLALPYADRPGYRDEWRPVT